MKVWLLLEDLAALSSTVCFASMTLSEMLRTGHCAEFYILWHRQYSTTSSIDLRKLHIVDAAATSCFGSGSKKSRHIQAHESECHTIVGMRRRVVRFVVLIHHSTVSSDSVPALETSRDSSDPYLSLQLLPG
jgi:predicted regulator of Ras-like GTPase activity (Roadblock/LC7/MglB family)